jgi:acetyl esterase/lipase
MATRLSRRQLLLPFSLRDRRVERVRGIQYAPGAGRRHRLDLYRPRAGVEGAPVLLQIHGGAWVIGDKAQQGLPLMLHLAAHGWVCVANNYRLSPRVTWPGHLVDCKLALAWVREHIREYGGDPAFVVVTGGSAGGHLAAMAALTAGDASFQPGFEDADTSVAGCMPFYGVYDVPELFDVHGGPRRLSARFERAFMGVSVDEDRSRFEQASPMAHIHADAPPFFVVHGAVDNLVPVTQARTFVEALRAVSRSPVVYAELPGASHAFEIFRSVRAANTVLGVERFLAWLHSAYRAAYPGVPADPEREAAAS